MEKMDPPPTLLTDAQLLARVTMLAAHERQATAALIAALTELDARRLYLGEGYPSLFAYCTQALRLSEDAAYNRIRAARVASKWPVVLDLIEDGSLTVTAIRLLSDVLTDTNHKELLRAATHKSKRDVEAMIATLNPQPPVAPTVRKLPTPSVPKSVMPPPLLCARALAEAIAPSTSIKSEDRSPVPIAVVPHPVVTPLSAAHYKIQFTVSKSTHDKLRRVQDLMRHANPGGNPAVIFDRALTVLLNQLEKAKHGTTDRPRKQQPAIQDGSRHVPASVKREVWARDSGQCAFVGTAGRCRETGFLEYHHVVPYADDGQANASNIQLRCRAHNAHEAEQWFGPLLFRERQPEFGLDSTVSGPAMRQRY
jgi:hypothetical protein